MAPAHRKKVILLVLALLNLGLLVCPGSSLAFDRSIFVLPSTISLGAIDPSSSSLVKHLEGISIMLLMDPEQVSPTTTLTVSYSQLMHNPETGVTIPADAIYATVGTQNISLTEPISFEAPNGGTLGMFLETKINPFKPPGKYEGVLRFSRLTHTESESTNDFVDVPLELEVLPWAYLSLAVPGIGLVSDGTKPGEDSFLITGVSPKLFVSSNTHWEIIVIGGSDFANNNYFDNQTIPLTNLSLRVINSDWVKPLSDKFISIRGNHVKLASGGPTGTCADGWVPIEIELKLPFTRSMAAGQYNGSLEFEIVTQ